MNQKTYSLFGQDGAEQEAKDNFKEHLSKQRLKQSKNLRKSSEEKVDRYGKKLIKNTLENRRNMISRDLKGKCFQKHLKISIWSSTLRKCFKILISFKTNQLS